MPSRSRLALLAVLIAVLIGAPVSGADLLQTRGAGAEWAVIETEAGARMVDPSGSMRAIRLPAGAKITDLGAVTGGWLLAGVRTRNLGDGPFLLSDVGGVVREVESPPSSARFVDRPSLLLDRGALAGLAWLEGDGPRSLALRVAAHGSEGWSRPRTLAAPGPGSQLALRATVLSDGRWLLVWSAFDGADDEVLWTVGRPDGAFTPPTRVAGDNAVPDITPSVIAVADGALLAWNRFGSDGEYRVVVSHFDGTGWSEPVVTGGPGGVRPALLGGSDPGSALLLFRTVEPDGWSLVELDGSGRAGRVASVATEDRDRPRLVAVDDGGVDLQWLPGGQTRRGSFAAAPR